MVQVFRRSCLSGFGGEILGGREWIEIRRFDDCWTLHTALMTARQADYLEELLRFCGATFRPVFRLPKSGGRFSQGAIFLLRSPLYFICGDPFSNTSPLAVSCTSPLLPWCLCSAAFSIWPRFRGGGVLPPLCCPCRFVPLLCCSAPTFPRRMWRSGPSMYCLMPAPCCLR